MISGLIVYSELDLEKNTWFINQCVKEFKDKGISLILKEENEVVDYLKNNSASFVFYRGRNFKIVEKIEEKGIRCFNNHLTNKIANDKWLSYQFLSTMSIPIIKSFSSLEEVKVFPLVMKSVDGHGGQEVYLIQNAKDVETNKKPNKRYVYQNYYPNSNDLRLYVLNKEIVGAVIRHNKNDFRSNYSLGGEVNKYNPSKRVKDLAIKVATLLNADYIGVDFIKINNRWCINEIEDPVGARMLYETSNCDITNLLVDYISSSIMIY